MVKRTYTIAFKKEVLEFIAKGHTAYAAAAHFGQQDGVHYDESMFYQWIRNKECILTSGSASKRTKEAGRKPVLGLLEQVLADEIVELRVMKLKVS